MDAIEKRSMNYMLLAGSMDKYHWYSMCTNLLKPSDETKMSDG